MSFLASLNPAVIQTKFIAATAIVLTLVATHGGVALWAYTKAEASAKTEVLESTIVHIQDHAKNLAEQQAKFNDSVGLLNKNLNDHTKTVKIITTVVEKEIEKPFYNTTIIPSSGMQLIASNANQLNSKRIPNGTSSSVSGSSATD